MARKNRLLLIEDDRKIADLIKLQAEIAGYVLYTEEDGIQGYRAIEKEKPDLVILDIMLPGQNGLDVCRKIKNHPSLKQIPLLLLSAKSEELDVLLGFELGADDYVTKPFSPKILFSRIKAILRRRKRGSKALKAVPFGEFTLEIEDYLLKKGKKNIPLTLSEFGILKRLVLYRGQILTRSQLLEDVHNTDPLITDRNIDVHIASLRKKLGPNFRSIETVRGIGYRFKEESTEKSSARLR